MPSSELKFYIFSRFTPQDLLKSGSNGKAAGEVILPETAAYDTAFHSRNLLSVNEREEERTVTVDKNATLEDCRRRFYVNKTESLRFV